MSMVVPSPIPTRPAELRRLQDIVQSLFPTTAVQVQNVKVLDGHIHPLRFLKLSNGLQLTLKISPRPTTALLRRERYLLETEARVLALLASCANPCIPQLFLYDPRVASLGSPFLLRQYIGGCTLHDIETQITIKQRKDIDRHLGFLVNLIGQQVAPSFGSLVKVASGSGSSSWKHAYICLFEDVLRDAEDMFINLPYAEIRREIDRLSPALEDVTVPRLVIVDFGKPSQIVVDPDSKQLCGVVDLGNAVWGDVLMAEIFESPSSAVLEGFGSRLNFEGSERVRVLLYACYRYVQKITEQYYRNRNEALEIQARRGLTATLKNINAIEL
ncbi:hypothetical protein AOR_1_1156154 [Paecilomyces variotii No. 5]|uniref:Aminoglycoside phosphotransferase domain-containing protein n=1 Tax=Byssochlamys spectabilis (strain No. 5 / NBRC 109023) TaxID=1356009 RepID=V5GDT7_BYSSN|nr:hypothetical protein AOR_1_1156154 [Paecilomyces variotii No. 5]